MLLTARLTPSFQSEGHLGRVLGIPYKLPGSPKQVITRIWSVAVIFRLQALAARLRLLAAPARCVVGTHQLMGIFPAPPSLPHLTVLIGLCLVISRSIFI